MPGISPTVFEALGGEETIRRLVNAFYQRVEADPVLRPLFPDDFTEVRERQRRFLTQFFGGPRLYTEVYGHPMLRLKHLRFPITPRHAQAWLRCMAGAMDEVGIQGDLREFMMERLTRTAYHMVNTPEDDANEDPHSSEEDAPAHVRKQTLPIRAKE